MLCSTGRRAVIIFSADVQGKHRSLLFSVNNNIKKKHTSHAYTYDDACVYAYSVRSVKKHISYTPGARVLFIANNDRGPVLHRKQ